MNFDGKKVLVLGATSAIAQEFARQIAGKGCRIVLAGRRADRLAAIAADLKARGAEAVCIETDLGSIAGHPDLIARSWAAFGGIDLALIAYGVYAEGEKAEETSTAVTMLETNFVSVVNLSLRLIDRFVAQASGRLAVITSVAGDRGRKRNYVYAASKGGLSVFLQGLDHKLAAGPVGVSDIKLGMADTPMTSHTPPSPLKCSPQTAAAAIIAGLQSDKPIIYAPWFWKWIMVIIRAIPRRVMGRLDL
jgi:short-subunit dehydrogenase